MRGEQPDFQDGRPHYMEVETRLQEQSEQETVVRSIGEDNEINLKISQDYLTTAQNVPIAIWVMDE